MHSNSWFATAETSNTATGYLASGFRSIAIQSTDIISFPFATTSHLVFLFIAATGCPAVDLEVLATGYTKLATGCIATAEVPAGFVIANHRLNLSAKSKRCRVNLFKRHRFVIVVKHLLVTLRSSTCWFLAQDHLLNHSVKAKRCRIHLFKRHRFAIANFEYHLLVNSSLRLDFFLYDVASSLASGSSIDWFYCNSLLISIAVHIIDTCCELDGTPMTLAHIIGNVMAIVHYNSTLMGHLDT
ncbi:hypothetical protein F511_33197 [Dorcoceras hygrometricum]|uniref:Uncharacterized protein n=1 Tax=Dorcoceras hygrometricum TaxID=472368 RepID=A0A2Z7AMC2_9LAMI|nr:hypothetical protein F511_33197 [Dorcoceras hygrometricum]